MYVIYAIEGLLGAVLLLMVSSRAGSSPPGKVCGIAAERTTYGNTPQYRFSAAAAPSCRIDRSSTCTAIHMVLALPETAIRSLFNDYIPTFRLHAFIDPLIDQSAAVFGLLLLILDIVAIVTRTSRHVFVAIHIWRGSTITSLHAMPAMPVPAEKCCRHDWLASDFPLVRA